MALPEVVKDTADYVPDRILGYFSLRSREDGSVLRAGDLSNVKQFHFSGTKRQKTAARNRIEKLGFTIVAESDLGFAVAGSKQNWADLREGELVTFERLMYTRGGRVRNVTHVGFKSDLEPVTAKIPEGTLRDLIDAVVVERPRAGQGLFPAPVPPAVDRYHLRVPDDVAMILGANAAHRRGYRGAGILVAMVDSGWYRHPYFEARGYKVLPPETVIPDTDPEHDPHGHGTGESANLFAVAPDATLLPIRASTDKGDLVGTLAGFMRAKQANPHIITNSWGGDYPYPNVPALPDPADRVLELEIRDAIDKEIVVVFAAGNGTFGMEAQVPGVIAAGGVFADAGLQLQATPYASGYRSQWFFHDPETEEEPITVPTVCGLVGMPPRAAYLMLPIPVGCWIDMERAAIGRDDEPDGTSPFDGWALFSGTSAAAPQVAGAAAVLLSVNDAANPEMIAEVLCETAVDVRAGRCHPRFDYAAKVGPDLATGHGLIDVGAAVDSWVPPDPVRYDDQEFVKLLADNGLLLEFLEKLAYDDEFRTWMEDDARAALKSLGLKGDFTYLKPVRLAPRVECRRVLEKVRAGRPYVFLDTTRRLTFMLH